MYSVGLSLVVPEGCNHNVLRRIKFSDRWTIVYIYMIWPYGQAVKTSPFHGGIPGSNPGRVTIMGA